MSKSTAVKSLGMALVVCCLYTWSVAVSCDSCGRECASACGTRNFRTCCFNYLRKRSGPSTPGVRLELLMVVPESAEYFPSSKNSLRDIPTDPSRNTKTLYEDPMFGVVGDDRPK